jgi:hypothetical protein
MEDVAVPQATWPLTSERPAIRISLIAADSRQPQARTLLADTGAGPRDAPFELLLDEEGCLMFAEATGPFVGLSGAYSGAYRTYVLRVTIPELRFLGLVTVVGIGTPPAGFAGIAGFRFLNRFSYGNFGNPNVFGLEN